MSAVQDGGIGRGFQAAGQTAQEGLGTVARILDLVLAARGGNLGGALQRQYQMTQDPDIRSTLANSPFGAGFTGLYGGQRPIGVEGQPSGAGPGLTPDWQYRANLPPLGEGATTELAQRRAQARLNEATVPYNLAHAREMEGRATLLERILAGNMQGGSDMYLDSYGAGGPTFRTPESVTAPPRSLLGGAAPQTGQRIGPGKVVGLVSQPEPKVAPVEAQKAVALGNTMLESLDRIATLKDRAPGKTGRVAGTIGRAADWAGMAPPETSDLVSAGNMLANAYRQEITGAAAPYAELGYLREILPHIGMGDTTFDSRLKEAARKTVEAVKARIQAAREIDRDIPELHIPPRLQKLLEEDAATTTPTTGGTTSSSTTIPAGPGAALAAPAGPSDSTLTKEIQDDVDRIMGTKRIKRKK